ncbi:MAG: tyrosine-type recombinase/integrase [Eubacteriales bacterium]|nr:tyrosine-type recombinase/integrase [Eubacteriales bacterium]
MKSYSEQYLRYLKEEREMSKNTLDAYRRDVREFEHHLEKEGVDDAADVTRDKIRTYLESLREKGRSQSTMSRKTSAIRSYVTYLYKEGIIDSNPSAGVKPYRTERKEIDYLTLNEIDRLLESPDDSVKGIRDRAILEVMYATGIRVTELTAMLLSEVNLTIGFVTCRGDFGKARIIPLGHMCVEALKRYVEESRSKLLASSCHSGDGGKAGEYLFLNYHGDRLTRQGLWKIVSTYAEKSGLNRKLTPQMLRNSFAVHMLQNGADTKTMKELMGFEDSAALQVYQNVTKNKLKEVYDKTHPRA